MAQHEDSQSRLQLRRAACEEHVMAMGLDPCFYVNVHCPVMLVWDGDKRHKHAFQQLAQPRHVDFLEWQQQTIDELMAEQRPDISKPALTIEPAAGEAHVTQSINQLEIILPGIPHDSGSYAHVQEHLQDLRRCAEYWQYRAQEKQVLQQFEAEHGHSYIQFKVWERAQQDPDWVCLTALNLMPWVANSPEFNMPAEHPGHTIKTHVRSRISANRLNYPLLSKGSALIGFVEEAIQTKLNGDAGTWHIKRSIEKLPCTLAMLSHDEGEELEVQYIFERWRNYEAKEENGPLPEDPGRLGHPVHDAGKQSIHKVIATGGKWIPKRKWT